MMQSLYIKWHESCIFQCYYCTFHGFWFLCSCHTQQSCVDPLLASLFAVLNGNITCCCKLAQRFIWFEHWPGLETLPPSLDNNLCTCSKCKSDFMRKQVVFAVWAMTLTSDNELAQTSILLCANCDVYVTQFRGMFTVDRTHGYWVSSFHRTPGGFTDDK